MKYYLAIDMGASSGRCTLGGVKDGIISFDEIHRFPNRLVKKDGELCWDFDALFGGILTGMRNCGELGCR